jgi:hypothetical protein
MFSSVVVIPGGGGEGNASADTKKEITESMIPSCVCCVRRVKHDEHGILFGSSLFHAGKTGY